MQIVTLVLMDDHKLRAGTERAVVVMALSTAALVAFTALLLVEF
jgi:hypothetical protein